MKIEKEQKGKDKDNEPCIEIISRMQIPSDWLIVLSCAK